jgi:hypothetical protein
MFLLSICCKTVLLSINRNQIIRGKGEQKNQKAYDKERINNVALEAVEVGGSAKRQTRSYKTKIRSLQKCLAASKLNIHCDGNQFNLHNFLHFPHFKSPTNCSLLPLRLSLRNRLMPQDLDKRLRDYKLHNRNSCFDMDMS